MLAPGPAWRLALVMRLLHDAVHGHADAGRDVVDDAGHGQAHGQPGGGVDEGGQVGERRHGHRPAVVGGIVVAAQHAEHLAQLVHRLAAGALDVGEQVLGGVRPGRQVAAGGRRLDHHHADRVGDDVVQLAGDARPLLGDPLAGEDLPLPLGPLGPVGERLDVLAAPAQVVAEHERGGEHAHRRRWRRSSVTSSPTTPATSSEADEPRRRRRPPAAAAGPRCGRRRSRWRRAPPASSAPTTSSSSQAIWASATTTSTAIGSAPPVHHRQRGGDDEQRRPPRRVADRDRRRRAAATWRGPPGRAR